MRRILAALWLSLGLSGMALAQGMPGNGMAMPEAGGGAEAGPEVAVETPWQDVITGQLEAFRRGDGAGALNFAAMGFKQSFADPDLFFQSIVGSGYGPLVESRSHSFGEFTLMGDTAVGQIVDLVGSDQKLYRAVYQLVLEPEGWRVQGVALSEEPGLAI